MIAAHSDWSVDPRKRWVTIGKSRGDGWVLDEPHPAGTVGRLLERLAGEAEQQGVVLGIDCPIGLPRAYAAQLKGYDGFPRFLRSLTPDALFFKVAETIEDVSLARPFYPRGTVSGPGHKMALAKALNLASTADLWRRVDLQTESRPAAGQLFWTLGANQCGKAALAAWRDLLLPALNDTAVKLWPFDGSLHNLAIPGQVVVAETYPAEALRQIGLKLTGSKRDQASRRALADGFCKVMERLRIEPSDALRDVIRNGFGEKEAGEDPFDSFIGALGVINILNGNRPDRPAGAADPWEGWVLGQTDLPKLQQDSKNGNPQISRIRKSLQSA
jgi:hypothetical protein